MELKLGGARIEISIYAIKHYITNLHFSLISVKYFLNVFFKIFEENKDKSELV